MRLRDYLGKWNLLSTPEGKSFRLSVFNFFQFETGVHEVNGIHVNLGLGLGPFEISLTLHHWRKWK